MIFLFDKWLRKVVLSGAHRTLLQHLHVEILHPLSTTAKNQVSGIRFVGSLRLKQLRLVYRRSLVSPIETI